MSRAQAFLAWAVETFGSVAQHRDERAARFFEEAVELVHAEGMPAEVLARIVARVYAGPPGDLSKEIGQAAATLEMLAENVGLSADEQAAREFVRVRTIPKTHWTERHDAKVALGIANLSP